MPIEIRELVVRMTVDQSTRSHSAYQTDRGLTERYVNQLKQQLREFCKEEIRDLIDREKDR